MRYDKRNFSRTLYQYCDHFSKNLRDNLVTGLIRGENIERMSSRLFKRLLVAQSRARTLVHTETTNIYEQACLQGYEAVGVEYYEYISSLDGKTSETCRELDGQHFKLEDAKSGINYPPMHPNCRSTTVVWFPDEEELKAKGKRLAKSGGGRYYEVPADMSYKQWRNEHVKDKPFMMGKQSAAIMLEDVEFADSHKELADYLQTTYNICYDKGMEKLSLVDVKCAVKGMEKIFDKFPDTTDLVNECIAEKIGNNVMTCGVDKIKFNPAAFNGKYSKKQMAYAGAHEAAHLLEWQLLDKMRYTGIDRENAWNNDIISTMIVKKALSETLIKYPERSKEDILLEISEFNGDKMSEYLADGVTKWMLDRKNSPALAREIYKEVRRWLHDKG